MSGQEHANRLGDYLRARRALVTPEQAGIPAGANRRVPGLRREELAMLAGISADYYLRLERGRDNHPSTQVLESLARVLRLDEVEQDYLLSLATPRPRTQRRRKPERVPARLHQLLASVGVPAFVEGRAFGVLASNPLALALSPRLAPGHNRLRSLLLDPEEQAFQQDWARSTEGFVAAFRKSVGDDIDDPRFVELVGELALSSERFRALWARHDIRALDGGTSIVNHPVVGELHLHRDKLPVDGLLLVLYYADQGSESDEKLRVLASLTASLTRPTREPAHDGPSGSTPDLLDTPGPAGRGQ
ncbi:helix-turn-helix domain-containing protein [Actinospica durhamensis]|uniref:Helix-turn-helix domain-containing protein n=1 Tax=Actinospica durhamensis TaxID=1508375 RepID=A0A941IVG9_9ACTN|nr:helix-turn-helix transcriptional regulator [Actinospica durhamensis]MBR7839338.1 helix-turn-helix domain-containing protein [Actinospica durhamensis]